MENSLQPGPSLSDWKLGTKRKISEPWLMVDLKLLSPPFFSIVLLSLGDKTYIHGFDPHLHAKNFKTYVYSTLSSFPIKIYWPSYKWMYLVLTTKWYNFNWTQKLLWRSSSFYFFTQRMTLPASQFSKVETVKPPWLPISPGNHSFYKYYLPCIFQIFLFLLNSFLQLLPGSSIYVTLINTTTSETLPSFGFLFSYLSPTSQKRHMKSHFRPIFICDSKCELFPLKCLLLMTRNLGKALTICLGGKKADF